jgi:hypothetical protein
MTSSYFMRSQKRTYATDAAKNTIVTAIQSTSCMGNLLGQFRDRATPKSESHPFASSGWTLSLAEFGIHFYEFSALPGQIDPRNVISYFAPTKTHPLVYQSR